MWTNLSCGVGHLLKLPEELWKSLVENVVELRPRILSCDSFALLYFQTTASHKILVCVFLFYFLGGFSGFHCKNDPLFCSAVHFLERCVFVELF